MNFVYTVNPNGGVVYKRAVEVPFSKNHLLERILSAENVRRAWKQVRANKGAPGIDGVTIEQFPDTFRELWPQIRSNLFEGTYVPSSVLRVEIPKPDGSKRPLGIPTVLDRLIQQAIAQVMGLIFDPLFSESSCGFRPGRSAHDGVRRVKQFIGQGYTVAVDTDLSKFFDTSSYCTPFHGKVLKRLICLSNALIYKPICFPLRTWTAGSLPDFTRCNTV